MDLTRKSMERICLKRTRYQVSYYEYALTNRVRRQFLTGIAALIFYWIVRLRFGHEAYVRFYEIKHDYYDRSRI